MTEGFDGLRARFSLHLKNRPWLRYLFAGFLACAFLAPFMPVLQRIGDEGTLVYGAQRVAEGALLYRDFFEVMGPACFWWLGLFFKVFGISFFVVRVHLLLTGVATALLLYWITRRVAPGPGDWWPSFVVTAISIPLWTATNHHWDSNLFFLAAVAAFLKYRESNRIAWLIASGLSAGATACFMQQKGAYLAFALATVIMISPTAGGFVSRLRHSALFFLVSALPILAVVIHYATQGHLADLVYATILWPLSQYSSLNALPYGQAGFSVSAGLTARGFSGFDAILRNSLAILTLPGAGLVLALPVLVVLPALWLKSRGRPIGKQLEDALPIFAAAAALYFAELHRKDFFHLIYGAPLLLVSFWFLLREVAPTKTAKPVFWCLMAMPFVIWGSGLLLGATKANWRVETPRGTVWMEQRDEGLDAMLRLAPERSTVFIYPYYPMYYFLADVKNPTRYSILVYGVNSTEQFSDALADVERKQVPLVLWDTLVVGVNLTTWFPSYRHPAPDAQVMEKILQTKYVEFDRKGGWRFLRRIPEFIPPPAPSPQHLVAPR